MATLLPSSETRPRGAWHTLMYLYVSLTTTVGNG